MPLLFCCRTRVCSHPYTAPSSPDQTRPHLWALASSVASAAVPFSAPASSVAPRSITSSAPAAEARPVWKMAHALLQRGKHRASQQLRWMQPTTQLLALCPADCSRMFLHLGIDGTRPCWCTHDAGGMVPLRTPAQRRSAPASRSFSTMAVPQASMLVGQTSWQRPFLSSSLGSSMVSHLAAPACAAPALGASR